MNQIFRVMLIGICLLFFTMSSFAKDPTGFLKPNVNTSRTLSNIGNWAYWMYDDGQSGIDPDGNSGGIYPRGTAGVIYEDGFVWGGFLVDPATGERISEQPLRVGGQTYRIGTQPGPIINGQPDSPANNRIYRIRSDWRTLSLGQIAQEIAEAEDIVAASVTESQAADYIAQYRTDWNEWPTDKGAPYVDADSNGTYDPVRDGSGDVTLDGDYPGIANADQVVYTVVNDLNDALTTDLYGSQPIGIELQITAWGYNQPGAGLGQLVFKKYKLINKSDYNMDSTYVSQWCDPDVGNYSDDVVGCDTVLSVGFAYNFPAQDASFLDFGLSPSVVGFDFFQGPLVEGIAGEDKNKNGIDDADDYAIFNLQDVGPGYINLPMTSFGYFAAGSPYGTDPDLGKYRGTKQWYNLLRGFGTINDDIKNPVPFLVGSGPNTGQITKFPMSGDPYGDPNGNLGDIDGQGDNPAAADRRMCLSTGPFTLLQWDDANGNGIPDYPDAGVQEIVVAIVGGNSGPSSSGDGHKSVNVMKNYDKVAQALFNSRFTAVPKAPPTPDFKAIPYRKSIVLDWGFNHDAVAKTEAKNPATHYDFQGYNVYQMPSANSSKDESVLIATFDLVDSIGTIWGTRFDPIKGIDVPVAVQLGKNSGIQRYIKITKDYIDGTELYPGRTYYFAITAYNYNPQPDLIEDLTLESPLLSRAVVPQGNLPGQRYSAQSGDDIEQITHSAGGSDGQVFATVVDPTSLTGGSYEIFFTEDTDTSSATYGKIVWNLRRAGETDPVVADQPVASSNEDITRARPIVDGVEVVVTGPPPEFKRFEVISNAGGPIDPPEMGTFAFNDNGFPFLFNSLYPDGTDRPDGDRQQTNGSAWGFNAGGGDGTWESFLSRTLRDDDPDRAIPYDYEMRFTADGGYGNWAFTSEATAPVPFELWNIGINTPDDPSDDYRMIPWVLDEVDEDDVYDYGTDSGVGLDSPVSGGDNDPYLDWVYWRNPQNTSPGTAGYDQFVADGLAGTYDFDSPEVWARTILINWNGGDVTDPTFPANCNALLPEEGTTFRITTNKPNTTADMFSFTAPAAPTYSEQTAKTDVEKINVYPNPYYANNSEEIGRFERFITFNHLPAKQRVTIRIFALNGVQVRKLEKQNDVSANERQFMRWDLNNEAGLPVASGLYIAYVDMPDIGKTKVLKLFIVQPAEILQYF